MTKTTNQDTVGNVLKAAARWNTGNTLGHLLPQVNVCVEVVWKSNLVTTGLRMQALAEGEGPIDNKAKALQFVNNRLKLNTEATCGHVTWSHAYQ